MSILEYSFFRNAILGSILASILCGYIGTYIVTRRLSFISGGITHASFGGIGLGVFFNINPILSAMVFSIFSAFGIQWMTRHGNVREDSAIAMFWTFGMSLGILFCFLTPGFIPDLPSFLFGSILTIDVSNLWLLTILCFVVILLFGFYGRIIVSVAFDNVFARSQRLPVSIVEYLMMALIAMTIVSTLRMVGIVLAMSLLTVPQMTANLFTYNYRRMIALSILFGILDCLLGLYLSYVLNVPSGASIIFVGIIIYAIAKAIKSLFESFIKRESA